MSTRQTMRRLSTPITLIILLGLLAAGTWWGYKAVTAKVQAPPTPCETMSMTELTPASVVVNVYNGGSKEGLAGTISTTLAEAGFRIGKVGNTDEKVQTVIIVGAAVDNPEVLLVAGWFQDPVIQADERIDHSVDVLLGNSFDDPAGTGLVAEPPASIQVVTGTVCLPPSPTPTPVDPADLPTQGVDPLPVEPAEPGEEPADEPGEEPGSEPT